MGIYKKHGEAIRWIILLIAYIVLGIYYFFIQ